MNMRSWADSLITKIQFTKILVWSFLCSLMNLVAISILVFQLTSQFSSLSIFYLPPLSLIFPTYNYSNRNEFTWHTIGIIQHHQKWKEINHWCTSLHSFFGKGVIFWNKASEWKSIWLAPQILYSIQGPHKLCWYQNPLFPPFFHLL